jgi:hypothetical protein
MRKIIGASLLTLALSCATYAGYIPCDVAVTPPPPSARANATQGATSADTQVLQGAESTATVIALNVLQSVLTLF